ncbi:ion channel (plasmid) [Haloferacaceae archaeon DSL9]
MYFTGYTIFTLGNGDFYPTAANWQVTTVLTSASGLLLITLIVTYVLACTIQGSSVGWITKRPRKPPTRAVTRERTSDHSDVIAKFGYL